MKTVKAIVDPISSSPSDAVLAVSRLLAPAGGPADAAAVRAMVLREASQFFGMPAALLLEVDDRERVARVIARESAGAVLPSGHSLADLPAVAELIDERHGRLVLDAERAAEMMAVLSPEAPAGPAILIAVGADVLVLAGAEPGSQFEGAGALGGVFVHAATAVLRQLRVTLTHAQQMERQLALTRAAKTLNESLDLETLLGRICHEAITLLGADNAAVYQGTPAEGYTVGGVAGLQPEFLGERLEPGTGLDGPGDRARSAAAHQRLPARREAADQLAVPARHLRPRRPVRLGRRAARRARRSAGSARTSSAPTTSRCWRRSPSWPASPAATRARMPGSPAPPRPTALTGCLNHAALHQHLARELERAARGAVETPSLALIDLDHFKRVNDEHGHLTGDEVLRRVGTALRSGIRPYDVAARYGGDEFALLITAADEEAALEVTRRAVDRVSAAIAEFVDGDAAGATAGVAAWTPGISAGQLIARSDRALMFGKQTQPGCVHGFAAVPEEWNRGRFEREHERGLPPAPPMPVASDFDPAEREERLRKRTRQLGLANALGARLAGMTDVREILEATADELHRAFGYYLCAAVQDLGDGTVGAAAVRGENFVRLGLRGWSQPREHGLIGRCLRLETPVLVGDVRAEPDYVPTAETSEVRSEMLVPLWVGDHLWGVLNVEEREIRAFDEDDLRLLETVADQAGAALRSASLYEQLERAYLGTAQALVAALEAKDAYTAAHGRSIVEQAEAVGRRLGMNDGELRDLRFAAVFHDIGKISVPEAILSKPGPLTDEERAVMERHTIVGEQILAPVEFLAGVRRLVRHEHERWDGAGYPDRLAGDAIPLGSRVILACDALHAMTSDRPYRSALPREVALDELRRHAGSQFDPRVIDELLELLVAAEPHPCAAVASPSSEGWQSG